jgi:hypothetical protein
VYTVDLTLLALGIHEELVAYVAGLSRAAISTVTVPHLRAGPAALQTQAPPA